MQPQPPPAGSLVPRRKVVVSAVAGAAVVLAQFLLAHFAGLNQTPEAIGAEVVIVSTALAYLIPEADQA
jgi:hypothetical protein